jgi:hypothetical protein
MKNLVQDTIWKTFAWGGIGSPILILVVIAVVGSLLIFICQAAGRGRLAHLIEIVCTLVAITMVTGLFYKAINAVFSMGD